MNHQIVSQVLQDHGARIRTLQEVVQLDDTQWVLFFADDDGRNLAEILVVLDEPREKLMLHGHLGTPHAASEATIHKAMLALNQQGARTGGLRVGLDLESDALSLLLDVALDEAGNVDFGHILEDFAARTLGLQAAVLALPQAKPVDSLVETHAMIRG